MELKVKKSETEDVFEEWKYDKDGKKTKPLLEMESIINRTTQRRTVFDYIRENEKQKPRFLIIEKPTVAEILYRTLLHNIPSLILSLLKLTLAAISDPNEYHGSISFQNHVDKDCKFDIARHKEIVVKGTSAIIFLLLKHFKKNHILQAEYISQLIVDANGIVLILKYFNQDIDQYVKVKTNDPSIW